MTKVFRGISHPKDEPGRNKYREKERRTKFTEKEAAAAEVGDYYLAMEAPGGMRYAVEVNGEITVVTHQLHKKYDWKESDETEWRAYDNVENLVIKIDGRQTGGDLRFAALRSIESTLHATPIGRALGRDAMRPVVEAFARSIGCDIWHEYTESEQAFTVDTKRQGQAKDALKALLEWAPENGYDERIGELGAEVDGVGYAENAEEYVKLLDGDSDGFGGEPHEDQRGEALPLLSEPVYYAVAGGKGDGRSFRSRLQDLKDAVGYDEED